MDHTQEIKESIQETKDPIQDLKESIQKNNVPQEIKARILTNAKVRWVSRVASKENPLPTHTPLVEMFIQELPEKKAKEHNLEKAYQACVVGYGFENGNHIGGELIANGEVREHRSDAVESLDEQLMLRLGEDNDKEPVVDNPAISYGAGT